jgi:N-acetyl-anhydromuramyl-L-alanine amidase AmpD
MANDNKPALKNGKLISSEVTDKVTSPIEKGALQKVDAIIVHQTGGTSAESTLSSYKDGAEGAHFLIDTDGTIYQTARVNQKCWHIGKIRSRCYQLKTCTADELTDIKGILFAKNESYSVRVKKLHDHESDKPYPERYPTNEDSIGIELVGGTDSKTGDYDAVTKAQNASLTWLISTLEPLFNLSESDIYRHPEVSYKQSSEASSAKWK